MKAATNKLMSTESHNYLVQVTLYKYTIDIVLLNNDVLHLYDKLILENFWIAYQNW